MEREHDIPVFEPQREEITEPFELEGVEMRRPSPLSKREKMNLAIFASWPGIILASAFYPIAAVLVFELIERGLQVFLQPNLLDLMLFLGSLFLISVGGMVMTSIVVAVSSALLYGVSFVLQKSFPCRLTIILISGLTGFAGAAITFAGQPIGNVKLAMVFLAMLMGQIGGLWSAWFTERDIVNASRDEYQFRISHIMLVTAIAALLVSALELMQIKVLVEYVLFQIVFFLIDWIWLNFYNRRVRLNLSA